MEATKIEHCHTEALNTKCSKQYKEKIIITTISIFGK
jgi:hypothetical protein